MALPRITFVNDCYEQNPEIWIDPQHHISKMISIDYITVEPVAIPIDWGSSKHVQQKKDCVYSKRAQPPAGIEPAIFCLRSKRFTTKLKRQEIVRHI